MNSEINDLEHLELETKIIRPEANEENIDSEGNPTEGKHSTTYMPHYNQDSDIYLEPLRTAEKHIYFELPDVSAVTTNSKIVSNCPPLHRRP